ncbi:phage tail assembly chaperone [Pseudomonas sp. SWRI51]|uniref:phage tail assembly chaperone n=1 Tax=Pseudomonas sp. SWRI51 TaxID=2745491 RepID=UPI001EE1DF6D|nr:phage tail assembly chaperone [Pseudomonas sp. SWRI51]
MSFKVLSVDAGSQTMVIDWGATILNHYIPQQVLGDSTLDAAGVSAIIETLRPAVVEPVEIPEVLAGLVQGVAAEEPERQWRDAELLAVTWLRDRHRDQLDIGAETTLTAEQFTELLLYMQQLRDWPQAEAFPLIEQRPVAPPWVTEQTP